MTTEMLGRVLIGSSISLWLSVLVSLDTWSWWPTIAVGLVVWVVSFVSVVLWADSLNP